MNFPLRALALGAASCCLIPCWTFAQQSDAANKPGPPSPGQVENPNKPLSRPQDAPAVFDVRILSNATRPAVALISVSDKGGKVVKTGTGFFVSKDGKLITNAHVIEGAGSATAKLESGATYVITGVVKAAIDRDLVLLQVEAKDVASLTLSKDAIPAVGARVAVIGSPLGLEGSVSDGIISGHRLLKKGDDWLQMTAPVSPGSSGSPVVDERGQVVGIATFVVDKAQALNFARPVEYVTQLLEQATSVTEPAPLWTIAGDPKNVVLNDPEFAAAEKLLRKEDAAGALKVLNGLATKYPENASLLFEFGLIYDRLNLLDNAVQAYQHALKLDPTSAVGWTNIGWTFEKLQRQREAKDAARQAVKLAPDLGYAWTLLGIVYMNENRLPDAVDALKKATQLTPKEAEGWKQLSVAYTKLNDAAAAQEASSKLQQLTADNSTMAAATASPPAGSPVAAPSVSTEQYKELVISNLRNFEEADVQQLMKKYPAKTNYYRHGVVDRSFIEQDLRRYFVRWPMTKTKLIPPIEVLTTQKPDEKIVRFRYEFRAASPDRHAFSVGTAWTTWTVWETLEGPKVFGESQNVERRQSH